MSDNVLAVRQAGWLQLSHTLLSCMMVKTSTRANSALPIGPLRGHPDVLVASRLFARIRCIAPACLPAARLAGPASCDLQHLVLCSRLVPRTRLSRPLTRHKSHSPPSQASIIDMSFSLVRSPLSLLAAHPKKCKKRVFFAKSSEKRYRLTPPQRPGEEC